MSLIPKREIWIRKTIKDGVVQYKPRQVYVVRKGNKIKSWIYVKGSGIRSKNEAALRYKQFNSLRSDITAFTRLSGNTGLYTTEKRIFPSKHTQIAVEYNIIKNGRVLKRTVWGYSYLLSRKPSSKDIENIALKNGINQGIFKYEDKIELIPIRKFYQSFKRF